MSRKLVFQFISYACCPTINLFHFYFLRQVQNSLCIVLMLQKSTTSDNENSFYVNLLQVIDDNRGMFLDVGQFDSIDLCFKVVSDATLIDEINLRKTFSLFFNWINQVCGLYRPTEIKKTKKF